MLKQGNETLEAQQKLEFDRAKVRMIYQRDAKVLKSWIRGRTSAGEQSRLIDELESMEERHDDLYQQFEWCNTTVELLFALLQLKARTTGKYRMITAISYIHHAIVQTSYIQARHIKILLADEQPFY